MTLQALFDFIQLHFPATGEAHLEVLLNNALDEFCVETDSIMGTSTITTTADTTEYTLDNRLLRIREVKIGTYEASRIGVDFTRVRLSESSYAYRVKGTTIEIGVISGGVLTALPAGTEVVIYGSLRGLSVTTYLLLYDSDGEPLYDSDGYVIYAEGDSLSLQPDTDQTWHSLLADHALYSLWKGRPDVEAQRVASRYKSDWQEGLRKARKYANTRRGMSSINPLQPLV